MSAPLQLTLGIIKPSVTAHQPHVQGEFLARLKTTVNCDDS